MSLRFVCNQLKWLIKVASVDSQQDDWQPQFYETFAKVCITSSLLYLQLWNDVSHITIGSSVAMVSHDCGNTNWEMLQ